MPHLHEAWWREVHLLTIGHLGSGRDGAPKASKLLEIVLDRYDPPPSFLRAIPYGGWFKALLARALPRWQLIRRLAWAMQRERFFAATALGDCVPLGMTNERRYRVRTAIEELLLLAISDARWTGQDTPWLTAAASSLSQLGEVSPEVLAALLSALEDSEWRVRQAAARSLGQLGEASPEVVEALVSALEDSEWRVRQAAARSLGQLGEASPEVVTALVGDLGTCELPVWEAAARSLGQLGEASPEIVAALVGDLGASEWHVRKVAHEALSELLDGKPLPGDKWVPLRERQERRQQRTRWLERFLLILVIVLPTTDLYAGDSICALGTAELATPLGCHAWI